MFSFSPQDKYPKQEQTAPKASSLMPDDISKLDHKNWQAEVYHRIAEMCWHWPKTFFDSVASKLSKDEQLQLVKTLSEKGHDCVYNAVNQGDSFFKMIADNPHLYPEEHQYLTQACIVNGDLTWCKYFRPGIDKYQEL